MGGVNEETFLVLRDLCQFRHGDVWVVKTSRKTTVEEGWFEPLRGPDVVRWYKTMVVVPPDDWPAPKYDFYRSHLRFGDMEALTEDEIMVNLRKLRHQTPNLKYFTRNMLRNSGLDIVWVRKVATL